MAEVPRTATRLSTEEPLTFGLGTWVQAEPSQCTVRVRNAVPSLYSPTAHALLAVRAVTAESLSSVPGFGLGTAVQDAPSQRVMSVCPGL